MDVKHKASLQIPDDLWFSFRPTPIKWWRQVLVVASLVAIPLLGWAVSSAGLVRPNLDVKPAETGWAYDRATGITTVNWEIRNDGVFNAKVESIDLPGLESIDSMRAELGGGSAIFSQQYRLTDEPCPASYSPTWRYRNWTGSHAVVVRNIGVSICEFAQRMRDDPEQS
jgi:hypothetical protein